VLIFPREYTTYLLLSKRKIFSWAQSIENFHVPWMFVAFAR
jgi:hypothetical protein